MSDRRLRLVAWASLALLIVLYLARIGHFVLQDPDEGRYAEIPREMVELGDWVTPRLNYVKYFEKPPLLYWLVATSFETFGTSEWSARLAPALAGIATVAIAYLLGVAMFGRRAALLGAGLLATSPLFFALSQVVLIDMLLTACFTATLAALFAAHRSERKTPWCVAAAVAAALAVLAKGLVGLVLPGAIGLAFLLWQRDFATMRAMLRPAPIAAFCAVAVPWFVLVSIRNPEFLHFFFVREHFSRFAGGAQAVGHPEAAWFYLPVLLWGPLPWTLLAALLALRPGARAAARGLPTDARRLLLPWAIGVVVFFSAASSKLPPYVLPAFPPLALLAGAWIDRLLDRPAEIEGALRGVAWTVLAIGGVLVVAGLLAAALGGTLAPRFDVEPREARSVAAAAVWTGVFVAGAGGIVVRRRWPVSAGGVTAAVAVLVLGFGLGLFGGIGARAVAKTSRDLAVAIEREGRPAAGEPALVVSYRRIMQSLSFYTRSRITMLDPHGTFNEIDAGADSAPDRARYFWTDVDRLRAEWGSGRRVFVATDRRMVPELDQTLSPAPRVLASDGRRVLLVNFPSEGGEPPAGAPAPPAGSSGG
jgi:4-amino-4-deoxy-L-arabinose transferase-like glycosyltransferase